MTALRASDGSRWLLPTLAGYRREWLSPDIVAGLTAGAVVVPQAMAYATIAKLPVQIGLYTCIIPMLAYALIGGSRAMSVSTTSTVATLTATTLVTAGIASGSQDAVGTLMALSLMVGLILLGAWILRLGSLVENINVATVLGVKIGVGGTVAIGQLPKLLGEDTEPSGEGFIRVLSAAVKSFESISLPTVMLSVGSILVMVLLNRTAPKIPGTLVVAVAGIALVGFAKIDDAGVALIDPVPSGLPIPAIPDLSHLIALVPGALAIAMMVFLESATVARGIRKPSEPPIEADRELLAAGVANIAGAFFSTLPAAGGLSQSAVNRAAGARTQLAGLVTVTLAVLIAILFAPVISMLPQATLAAMVVVAVSSLIDIPTLIRWAHISPTDFWIALVVAAIGLTAGLLPAVGAGVIVTLFLVLREINTPRIEIVEKRGNTLALHLGLGLYTANARSNEQAIIELATEEADPVSQLILDVRRIDVMTVTVLDTLTDLDHELADKGICLHLAGLPVRATTLAAKTSWFRQLVAAGRIHTDVDEAFEANQ
ncbi:SulP family inorganic anion transporter [Brevibacterium linens]|uniref:SulP family inorganic anion transporter n=1 Tax=Brevibacterium linens TaxID=1703 RepID=UPI003BF47DF8